jgi:hypothetical protein
MIKTLQRLTLVMAITAIGFGAFDAVAEPSNPSIRSLNKMSRRGNPTVSIMSLATVCPTVKTVTGNEFLWKSEISKHIGSGDSRAAGPSFICGRICASRFPMDFFYSDGSKAGRVGYYGTYHGNGQPRAYCSVGGAPKCSIADIAKKSTLSGRDGYLYLQLSKTTCYKVRPLGRTGRV